MTQTSNHKVKMPSEANNVALYIVYINVILYATCYQLQRPLEPYLVEKLRQGVEGKDSNDAEVAYAQLQSFFQIIQTIGSFFSGIFLDKFGVKGGFLISFAGSAACYALLSQATDMRILYYSKIPTVFQAGFLCAQVAVAQVTANGSDRVQALGRLTMCYTIGSILGPALGGILGANGDYYYGAKLAVGGSILSILLTLMMPNTSTTTTEVEVQDTSLPEKKDEPHSPSPQEQGSVKGVIAALPLVLKNQYSLQEQAMGYTMSLMSGFNAIVNGGLLGPIVVWAGGDMLWLIAITIVGMAVLSGGQAVAASDLFFGTSPHGLYVFLTLTFLLSGLQYVLSTTITSESTSQVGSNEKGTLLGLEHSLFAAARVATPLIGVQLLQEGGIPAVTGTCSLVFFGTYMLFTACKTSMGNRGISGPGSVGIGMGMGKGTSFVSSGKRK